MNDKYQGLPASSGIAIGPLWIYRPVEVEIEHNTVKDVDAELSRLEMAMQTAKNQLEELEEKARVDAGEEEAAIFEAHRMFLDDPELLKGVTDTIEQEALNAEAAVNQGFEMMASQLEMLENEYFQARAMDLRDVAKRVVRVLAGVESGADDFPKSPVVIFADDLMPSDTVQFEKDLILGFATVKGGPTSHTAILARSMGIPAIVSLPINLDELEENSVVVLNGENGDVFISPDEDKIELARKAQKDWKTARNAELAVAHEPAVTIDGKQFEVVANIGNLQDAKQAIEYGAEGVGLFRTEFLYLERNSLPDEEEQLAAYCPIFEVMAGKPVVVRTLDIGGDKEVPYLGFKEEANPFLGWRAIRMVQENRDLLKVQLRALLRAGVNTDLRIMVPMISRLSEVEMAREILQQAQEELKSEGVDYAEKVQFGIMIEVPSIVMIIEHIVPMVDFFSIGTNDLTQYTMAVDRTNERVAQIATPFHPSVLRLLKRTIKQAHKHGKWVGLCGEFAGDPLATPLLIGMGLDEFSMASTSVPQIKSLIRKYSAKECRKIAKKALKLPKQESVRRYLEQV